MGNLEASRRYRERNRDRVLVMKSEWAQANKGRVAAYSRSYNLRKKGFTSDIYLLALALQGQACAICRRPFSEMAPKEVHADHDHKTNSPRGVLCHYCNVGLGVFKDSPELLAAAASYLSQPSIKEIKVLEPKVEEMTLAIQQNTNTMKELIAVWNKLAETTNARPIASGTIAANAEAEAKKQDAKPAAGQTTATAKTEAAAPESTTSASDPAAQSAAQESQASTAATTITYDQVAKAITEGVKTDRAKVVAVLAKFGAKKGTELKTDQWAAFLAELA